MDFKNRLILLILLCIITRVGYSQPWYFNEIYNPNKTWASGLSIIGTNQGYFGCSISSDSISSFYYTTCTFILNPMGEIVSWKNFGLIGSDYFPGDEGALVSNKDGFVLFGSVQDWVNDSIYGLFYKFDNKGDTILTRSFSSDTDSITIGRTCATTIDGGFVLLGNVSDYNTYNDIILIKTDSIGHEQWRDKYGTDSSDWPKSIIQTPDKGYAFGSWTYINGDEISADPIVYKTDSLGNLKWSVNLGGPYMDDKPVICNTKDSCIIVLTAYADSMYTPEHAYTRINLVKLDLDGNVTWNKKYGTSKPVNYISKLITLDNGDMIACGYAKYSIYLNPVGWLFRFNSVGDSLWYREYFYYPEDPTYGINYLFDVSLAADHGFITTGEAFTLYPPNDVQKMWVLKVDSVGCEIENCWVGIEDKENGGQGDTETRGELEVWPNPAKDKLYVRWNMKDGHLYRDLELEINDIFGHKVSTLTIPALARNGITLTIDVSTYSPGIYIAITRENTIIKQNAKFIVFR